MTDIDGLEALAKQATPGDLDTVPNPASEYGGHSTGEYDCPACDGSGEVEGETYCNFDGLTLGVQFFGIGNAPQNYEAYFRAASPSTILALITRLRTSEAKAVEAVERAERAGLSLLKIVDELDAYQRRPNSRDWGVECACCMGELFDGTERVLIEHARQALSTSGKVER